MFSIENIIRKNIRNITPYSSARDEYRGKDGIFLDANENSIGSADAENLNRYPDPHQNELKEKLAEIKGLTKENIFVGNGSDEAIDLLIRAFCNPGKDKTITLIPTYGMYKVSAAINDIEVIEIELTKEFQINIKETLRHFNEFTKLIFICSPNNPTGNIINKVDIEIILKEFKGVVVLDEAYIDFAEKNSFVPFLKDHPNLVILQTLSKAWGLANIRLGMALSGNMEIINVLNNIKPPYNIAGNTQKIALRALQNIDKKNEMVKTIIEERELLKQKLIILVMVENIYPSDANFLLVKMTNSELVFNYLTGQKIITRNRSNVALCEGCLRITTGTNEENNKLITTLKSYEESIIH
ncbi:histidinol-phosphate transaminase [soil metagenome]